MLEAVLPPAFLVFHHLMQLKLKLKFAPLAFFLLFWPCIYNVNLKTIGPKVLKTKKYELLEYMDIKTTFVIRIIKTRS